MSHLFDSVKGRRAVGEVARLFQHHKAYLAADRHVVFVCGGKVDASNSEGAKSLRHQFVEWGGLELEPFRIFLAERATEDLWRNDPTYTFHNLAEFESLVGGVADCILIFPESEGALAELGYFCAVEVARKKVLIANDLKYQSVDSFINLGPVALADHHSVFRSTVYLQTNTTSIDFSPIRDRLTSRIPRLEYRTAFHPAPFGELKPLEQLAIIQQVVNCFGVLDLPSLIHVIDELLLGEASVEKVRQIVSLLVALDYFERQGSGNEYIVANPRAQPMLEFDRTKFRNSIVRSRGFMQTSHPEIFELVELT